jgi:hypothetical protein
MTPRERLGHQTRASLVLISILATIAFNALSQILPLMGRTAGDISDAFPVPFTPAGYVFSIWSVIYVGLIAYGVWQARPAQWTHPHLQQAAPWVLLSGALNVAWLVAWHALAFAPSLVIIVLLLASVVRVYVLTRRAARDSTAGTVLARLPFAIYAGWLSVATIANASVLGWSLGWQGAPFSADTWTIIMILVATLLGLVFLRFDRNVPYAAVLVWAFIGIAVAAGFPSAVASVAVTVTALLLGGAIGVMVQRPGRTA